MGLRCSGNYLYYAAVAVFAAISTTVRLKRYSCWSAGRRTEAYVVCEVSFAQVQSLLGLGYMECSCGENLS